MTTPDDVIAEARKWDRVPYHHQGRVRAGVDCVGLVVVVLSALGVMPEGADRADYGRHPNGTLNRIFAEFCTPIPAAVPGCVATIRWTREAHHVAIVAALGSELTLIHSHQSHPGVREHTFTRPWRTRCLSFHALPGVTYRPSAS